VRHGLVCFVLFITLESVAGVEIPDSLVTIASPLSIMNACRGHSRIACTTFRDVWMTCQCELSPKGWSIRANVRATPLTFLTSIVHLRHETLHVNDFRYYLGKHVQALEAKAFDSRRDCDMFATLAMNAFSRTFQSVARISMTLRDGKRQDTSEDHLIVMQAEIVPQLVNDGVADLTYDFAMAASDAEDRTAKNRDLVRQRR
jgi:hypothetical protein